MNLDTFDLSLLPTEEDDQFEFKSSLTSITELKKKLARAASGFSNSGGGCFVAGVGAFGDADGGFERTIGRTDLRDWVDQVVGQLEPAPKYSVRLLDDASGRGVIKTDHSVLVVNVNESHFGPHMAPDGRYYIRAGAHTVMARHFIVEAIWAKRHLSKPRLRHVFRSKPDDQDIVQLGIVSVTDAPAIDVRLEFSPLPKLMTGCMKDFPVTVGVIDRRAPFFFDVTTWHEAEERFGSHVELRLTYHDLASNEYTYAASLAIGKSLPSLRFTTSNERIARSLESIDKVTNQFLKKQQ